MQYIHSPHHYSPPPATKPLHSFLTIDTRHQSLFHYVFQPLIPPIPPKRLKNILHPKKVTTLSPRHLTTHHDHTEAKKINRHSCVYGGSNSGPPPYHRLKMGRRYANHCTTHALCCLFDGSKGELSGMYT
jgi:hypothetical protein